MMTVRFQNGQAIQYNNAGYVVRSAEYSDLYEARGDDGKGKNWIAQVPNSCVIECRFACRVYDALQERPLDDLTREIRSLKRKIVSKRK